MLLATSSLVLVLGQPAPEPEPAPASEPEPESAPAPESAPEPESDAEIGTVSVQPRPAPAPPTATADPFGRPGSANQGEVREAKSAADDDTDDEDDDFVRTGVLMRALVGFGGCTRKWCSDDDTKTKIGPAGAVELGYRPIAYLDVRGRFDIQRMVIDADSADIDAAARYISLGAEASIHPLARTRFDPYAGAGAGLGWYRERYTVLQDASPNGLAFESINTFRRPYGALHAGLDVYLTPSFALGPMFRYVIPFAGRVCSEGTPYIEFEGLEVMSDDAERCAEVADAIANDVEDDLPHVWSFSLAFTGTF